MKFKKKSAIFCTLSVLSAAVLLCGFAFAAAPEAHAERIGGKKSRTPTALLQLTPQEMPAAPNTYEQDPGEVKANFSDTKAAENLIKNISEKSGNFFSVNRIDIAAEDGFKYQGLIFACAGTSDYRQTFLSELDKLITAYPVGTGGTVGYLDPIRDNRLRSYGDNNFFRTEKITLPLTTGDALDVYVVTVCGSENFKQPYKEFWDAIQCSYID